MKGNIVEYKVLVNNGPEKNSCHSYKFNYSNVKDIRMNISEGELSVELQMKTKKNADEIFTERNNCFSEALKKGMLFHLILYSKPLPTGNIRIFIDGEEEHDWNTAKSPVVYSLISKELKHGFPAEWQNADKVFEHFLKNTTSAPGNLTASVYALLYSKAKDNETERFQYLWMAMNGLYNHLAEEYKRHYPQNDKDKINSDLDKIVLLEKAENWGTDSITGNKRDKMAKVIENVLREHDFERSEIDELLKEELKSFQRAGKQKGIEFDGYLKLWYPYYLRCNMFHASKPIPMFSLEEEDEVRQLRFVNDKLEDYLDQNLLQYFSDAYCEEKLDNRDR